MLVFEEEIDVPRETSLGAKERTNNGRGASDPVELALKGVLCTSLGSEGSLIHGFSPFIIYPTAMPW